LGHSVTIKQEVDGKVNSGATYVVVDANPYAGNNLSGANANGNVNLVWALVTSTTISATSTADIIKEDIGQTGYATNNGTTVYKLIETEEIESSGSREGERVRVYATLTTIGFIPGTKKLAIESNGSLASAAQGNSGGYYTDDSRVVKSIKTSSNVYDFAELVETLPVGSSSALKAYSFIVLTGTPTAPQGVYTSGSNLENATAAQGSTGFVYQARDDDKYIDSSKIYYDEAANKDSSTTRLPLVVSSISSSDSGKLYYIPSTGKVYLTGSISSAESQSGVDIYYENATKQMVFAKDNVTKVSIKIGLTNVNASSFGEETFIALENGDIYEKIPSAPSTSSIVDYQFNATTGKTYCFKSTDIFEVIAANPVQTTPTGLYWNKVTKEYWKVLQSSDGALNDANNSTSEACKLALFVQTYNGTVVTSTYIHNGSIWVLDYETYKESPSKGKTAYYNGATSASYYGVSNIAGADVWGLIATNVSSAASASASNANSVASEAVSSRSDKEKELLAAIAAGKAVITDASGAETYQVISVNGKFVHVKVVAESTLNSLFNEVSKAKVAFETITGSVGSASVISSSGIVVGSTSIANGSYAIDFEAGKVYVGDVGGSASYASQGMVVEYSESNHVDLYIVGESGAIAGRTDTANKLFESIGVSASSAVTGSGSTAQTLFSTALDTISGSYYAGGSIILSVDGGGKYISKIMNALPPETGINEGDIYTIGDDVYYVYDVVNSNQAKLPSSAPEAAEALPGEYLITKGKSDSSTVIKIFKCYVKDSASSLFAEVVSSLSLSENAPVVYKGHVVVKADSGKYDNVFKAIDDYTSASSAASSSGLANVEIFYRNDYPTLVVDHAKGISSILVDSLPNAIVLDKTKLMMDYIYNLKDAVSSGFVTEAEHLKPIKDLLSNDTLKNEIVTGSASLSKTYNSISAAYDSLKTFVDKLSFNNSGELVYSGGDMSSAANAAQDVFTEFEKALVVNYTIQDANGKFTHYKAVPALIDGWYETNPGKLHFYEIVGTVPTGDDLVNGTFYVSGSNYYYVQDGMALKISKSESGKFSVRKYDANVKTYFDGYELVTTLPSTAKETAKVILVGSGGTWGIKYKFNGAVWEIDSLINFLDL
jgi:hypothetical protein